MLTRKPSFRNPRSGRSFLSSAISSPIMEALERRQLLSGYFPLINSPIAGAYTPNQIRNAYGVNSLGLANEGQGVTIGIVDELDDPNIMTDANAFSTEYNLPLLNSGGPTLTVTKDTTMGSVGSASGTGVAAETSLDVEWAHAMAPMANILLTEVPATGSDATAFAELLQGVQATAATTGVVSVSLSYGATESAIGNTSVVSENSTYLAAGAAANISVLVSAGDGSTPDFPATSPNVVAVGGTSLYLASLKGNYSFETAWGGLAGDGAGGGGVSTNFATPTFQSANGVNSGKRAVPDVALDADPVTAVSIYDSLDSSTAPWTAEGGTSVATPIFAGMISLAQQNRLANGLSLLSSAQIDTEMYQLYDSTSYSTYFHDITQGSNKDVSSRGSTSVTGFSATTGYDEATGIGSPIASTLIPLLSTYAAPSVTIVAVTSSGGLTSRLAGQIGTSSTVDASSVSLYDLVPVGKAVPPNFVQAVAQAQQSPVVSYHTFDPQSVSGGSGINQAGQNNSIVDTVVESAVESAVSALS